MTDTIAITFGSAQAPMPAIVHGASLTASAGVLVIVGGPQYRVGSHRQFTLLARALSAAGTPVMRFDYQGMGDAAGSRKDFTDIHHDIGAAVDEFAARQGLDRVVLWGLCDAASAALLYAWQDPRIVGMVLLNPWVRTEEGLARARLRTYYSARLLAPAFWKKVARGELHWGRSLRALAGTILRSREAGGPSAIPASPESSPLPDRMANGLRQFRGRTLFLVSGNDLTAAEFRETVTQSRAWSGLTQRDDVQWREFPAADHTFSRREWRDQVADVTRAWLRDLALTGFQ